MDIRIEKTRNSICNAFLEIRVKKNIEKITIKELCETARINKSTFYDHYKDIYDLSDSMETEVVISVLDSLKDPEEIFDKTTEFINELIIGFFSCDGLIRILFTGSRKGEFIRKTDVYLREMIFKNHPEFKDNIPLNAILTYTIYGTYHAYYDSINKITDRKKLVKMLADMANNNMKEFIERYNDYI